MSVVTIFEVNVSRSHGRQIFHGQVEKGRAVMMSSDCGDELCEEELAQLQAKAKAVATWNCNGHLVARTLPVTNLSHKISLFSKEEPGSVLSLFEPSPMTAPTTPRSQLMKRLAEVVASWFPRQDVVILYDPAG